jgi:hypothetical protein
VNRSLTQNSGHTQYSSGFADLGENKFASEFLAIVLKQKFSHMKICDFSAFFQILTSMARLYLGLLTAIECKSTIFARVILENTWRISPYCDSEIFIRRMHDVGIPVIEDSRIMIPEISDADNLIQLGYPGMGENPFYDKWPEDERIIPYVFISPIWYMTLRAVGAATDPSDLRDYQLCGWDKIKPS